MSSMPREKPTRRRSTKRRHQQPPEPKGEHGDRRKTKQPRLAISLVGETSNITRKRITRKLGVFATGKESSTVRRGKAGQCALSCADEERRAREEQDLSKILKLARADQDPRLDDKSSGGIGAVCPPLPDLGGRYRERAETSSDSGTDATTCSSSHSSSWASLEGELEDCIEEEEVLREVSRELTDPIQQAIDSIFPNEGVRDDSDYFVKTCRYLQRIHLQHSTADNWPKDADGADRFSAEDPLDRQRHDEGTVANGGCAGRQFATGQGRLASKQGWATSSSGLKEKCDDGRAASQDPSVPRFTPTVWPRSKSVCRKVGDVRGPGRDNTSLRQASPGVFPYCQAPKRQRAMETVCGNRQQILKRLQDPNDKDILDYVDNVQFDTPVTGVGLTTASPDSVGDPTWQFPTVTSSLEVPNERPSPSPRIFRYKFYENTRV